MSLTTLIVAAVCFEDDRSRILTVRKHGTTAFMLPGGKLEPEESPSEAAVREVREEVGIDLRVSDLSLLGRWSAVAANESNTDIVATVFTAALAQHPSASGEIAELLWIPMDDADPESVLAPLLREFVFPALMAVR